MTYKNCDYNASQQTWRQRNDTNTQTDRQTDRQTDTYTDY